MEDDATTDWLNETCEQPAVVKTAEKPAIFAAKLVKAPAPAAPATKPKVIVCVGKGGIAALPAVLAAVPPVALPAALPAVLPVVLPTTLRAALPAVLRTALPAAALPTLGGASAAAGGAPKAAPKVAKALPKVTKATQLALTVATGGGGGCGGGGGAASPPLPSSRARTAFALFSSARRASVAGSLPAGAAPSAVKAALAAAWASAPSPVVNAFLLAECNEAAALDASDGKLRGGGGGGGSGGKKKTSAKKLRRGGEEDEEEEEEDAGEEEAEVRAAEGGGEEAGEEEEEEEEEEESRARARGVTVRRPAHALAAATLEDERAAAASRAAAAAAAGRGPSILPCGAVVEEGGARFTRANMMPRCRGSFNYAPYTFALGTRVGVILPALYDWTAELAAGEGGAAGERGLATLQMLQDRGALSALKPLHGATRTGVLWGTVAALQEVGEAAGGGAAGGGAKRGREAPGGSRGWHLLRLALDAAATAQGGFALGGGGGGGGSRARRGGGGGGGDGGEEGGDAPLPAAVTVPWLPPSHPLVNAPFVITWEAYAAALCAPLRPGTQVRMLFAPEAGEGAGGGRWHEGRVYATTARTAERACGWAATAYKATRVVWYDQLASGPWVLEALQTDNDVSPWELCTRSPFVPPAVRAAYAAAPPPELASPLALLEHLLTTEPAALFLELPTEVEAPQYRARVEAPTTLPALAAKARAGGYAGAAARALWDDLRTLITNAKGFNQRYTLAWRCADALEAEVRRVRKAGFDARLAAAAAAAGGGGEEEEEEEEEEKKKDEKGGGGGGDGGGAAATAAQPRSPPAPEDTDPWESSWVDGFSQGLFSQEYVGGEEGAGSPLLGAGGGGGRDGAESHQEPRGFGAYSRPGAASKALSQRMAEEEGGQEEEEEQ